MPPARNHFNLDANDLTSLSSLSAALGTPLACTKHRRRASSDSGFNSSSSILAVSSCSLLHHQSQVLHSPTDTNQDRIDSSELTWKYGSSRRRKYIERPSCCHSKCLQLFPALARSQRIGSANCFKGELDSMTRFRLGIMPACAASSCRDLFKRQRL